ncbi:DUF680 domain-containing protein [Mesorhizobium sp. B2-4-17]|uniref:DUF680 domain-containing protein n=1 Tax=Mesorhizobium sp. B2-4-17 TaxID=2589932 RepID=UPI00112CF163|nr:DUF680 domain-containing protein [Mesorhizobium sp. B2-4-17]TPK92376.1 DUF680 domain-containing protein [Mesorhizobium sp. B2-4-17]
MNKIAFTAAAFLLATGTAFAGSDHYGSENVNWQPAPVSSNIDRSLTGSIHSSVKHNHVNSATGIFQDEPGQGIWGR